MNPSPFRKVGIVGLGLIGGSLALCASRAYGDLEIAGVDRLQSEIDIAWALGCITKGSTAYEILDGCDLIVLSTPISSIIPVIKEILPLLADDAVITDVGSTKALLATEINALLRGTGRSYIGGHPMAGSERSGMQAATELLFENAVYIICPGDQPREKVEMLKGFLSCTRAIFREMDPESHDEAVAAISHMPHIAAAAMVNAVGTYRGCDPLALAGGGFRDTTRIASGSPRVWLDILQSNKGSVLKACDKMAEALNTFRARLESDDSEGLEHLLSQAKELRDTVSAKQKGLLLDIYDIVVALADEPGAINRVAGILGNADLNIVDIEILRIREGFGGTLRIGFADAEEAGTAVSVLNNNGFIAHKR